MVGKRAGKRGDSMEWTMVAQLAVETVVSWVDLKESKMVDR
jgi:hypothetical protein